MGNILIAPASSHLGQIQRQQQQQQDDSVTTWAYDSLGSKIVIEGISRCHSHLGYMAFF